jgi:hypothetical protein
LDKPITITDQIHRQLATDLYNQTWDLIDQDGRGPEETRTMVNSAHASLYHWRRIGEPVNLQRGEWLISRVYALVGSCEAALDHAAECLRLTTDHQMTGFDPAFAHEAVARAVACAGDAETSGKHRRLAEEAGNKIEDREDREYFLKDLASGPWFDER